MSRRTLYALCAAVFLAAAALTLPDPDLATWLFAGLALACAGLSLARRQSSAAEDA